MPFDIYCARDVKRHCIKNDNISRCLLRALFRLLWAAVCVSDGPLIGRGRACRVNDAQMPTT